MFSSILTKVSYILILKRDSVQQSRILIAYGETMGWIVRRVCQQMAE